MKLKFLDQRQTKQLLSGHKDILTPLVEAREKTLYSQPCPKCGGFCKKTAYHNVLFRDHDILPHFYLKCAACGHEFDPETGLIVKLGNIAQAVEPVIPILKNS
jgi:DNA-directed RNA polymerase subunit M/transcription elongation factor TFIIS